MKICKLVVDATCGPMQEVGETVQTGQVIGRGPDGQPVESPVDGRIVGLDFDPESHQFAVTIDAVVPA